MSKYLNNIGIKSKIAFKNLAGIDIKKRNRVLESYSKSLSKNKNFAQKYLYLIILINNNVRRFCSRSCYSNYCNCLVCYFQGHAKKVAL